MASRIELYIINKAFLIGEKACLLAYGIILAHSPPFFKYSATNSINFIGYIMLFSKKRRHAFEYLSSVLAYRGIIFERGLIYQLQCVKLVYGLPRQARNLILT